MHLGLRTLSVGEAVITTAAAAALHYTITRTTHWHETYYSTATFVVVTIAILAITYRDRTLAGWIRHRRTCTRRTPRLTQILSHNSTAILWDHTTGQASVLIGITPKPFTINIVDENDNWSSNTLDLDPVRHELRQFDIELHDLTLTTVGYTYAQQNDLAKVAFTTTGSINALAYGRTHLRVTIDTATSAHSIHAREIDTYADPRETLAAATARTLQIASSRAHRAITLQGFIAQKLSKNDAQHLHRDLVALLGADALAEEGFAYAGKDAPHLVSFTPTTNASARTHSEWLRATTEVCASITRMTPASASSDHIEQYYLNKVQRLDTVDLAEATDLRREYGQHAAIATTALPLAVAPSITAVPKPTATADTPTPHAIPQRVGGAGIYLGYTSDGTRRVWLDITVASDDPLWIIGPREAIELLLIRTATLGLRVDIRAPQLADVAHALRHAGIGRHEQPDITIAAIGDDNQSPAPVRILWAESPIRQQPRYLIDATNPGILQVRCGTEEATVRWEFNAAEQALLKKAPTRR